MLSIGSIFKGFTEAKSMEINWKKQAKEKDFTELNHSIFHTSLWRNELFQHRGHGEHKGYNYFWIRTLKTLCPCPVVKRIKTVRKWINIRCIRILFTLVTKKKRLVIEMILRPGSQHLWHPGLRYANTRVSVSLRPGCQIDCLYSGEKSKLYLAISFRTV